MAAIRDEDARWASYLYSEPDSQGREVLRNLPDIQDAGRLAQFERLETTKMGRDLPRVTADADGLRAMHHHLFKTVYPWAGQYRAVNMSKGDSDFIPEGRIDAALAHTFRGEDLVDRLRRASMPEATETFARVVSDVNYVHPFREGNGRTMRAFVTSVARDAGWKFDETKIDAMAWNQGSIESFQDPENVTLLTAAIENAVIGRAASEDRRSTIKPPEDNRSVGREMPAVREHDPVKAFSDAVLAVRDARVSGIMSDETFDIAVDQALAMRRDAIASAPEDRREKVEALSAALMAKTLGVSADDIARADQCASADVDAAKRQSPAAMRR